jgi:hypothetical protein
MVTQEDIEKAVAALTRAMDTLKDDPERRDTFMQLLNSNPTARDALVVMGVFITLKVFKQAQAGAGTKEEAFELVRPFITSEDQWRGLEEVWASLEVDRSLRLLMGEDYHTYESVDEVLKRIGIKSREEFESLTPSELMQHLSAAPRLSSPFTESEMVALDLIFEQRYGWEPGTASKLTAEQLWEALRHALDTDKMRDPKGIWRLTK